MIGEENVTSYSHAYYSYGTIYYNLSTASGWMPHMIPQDYLDEYNSMISSYKNNNCKATLKFMFGHSNNLSIAKVNKPHKNCEFY